MRSVTGQGVDFKTLRTVYARWIGLSLGAFNLRSHVALPDVPHNEKSQL
ncbi:MAG: hypothetical protein K8L91_19200 [Anaerolineae bacterium]|nr:hypothetical protein [Anaerolineae bacterium]